EPAVRATAAHRCSRGWCRSPSVATGTSASGWVCRGSAARAVGHRLRSATDRERPGLDDLLDAERLEHPVERIDLVLLAGRLDALDDVHQLVELLGHLFQRRVVDVHDDRDAGEPHDLRGAHRQRMDVEAAAGDEAGEAREHTGLVLDEDGQCVAAHASSPSSDSPEKSGRMSRAYWMWSLLTTAATIGHTIASAGPTKSMTTGRSSIFS